MYLTFFVEKEKSVFTHKKKTETTFTVVMYQCSHPKPIPLSNWLSFLKTQLKLSLISCGH